jgi:hypothetical protein
MDEWNPAYDSIDDIESWKEFWGETTDEKVKLLDATCWELARWICVLQARFADPPGDHGIQRFVGGGTCDPCYDIAWHLMDGELAHLFSAYGQAAWQSGQDGASYFQAAAAALRKIGMPISDRLEVEAFLRSVEEERENR